MKEFINDVCIEGYVFKLDLLDENGKPRVSKKSNVEYLRGSVYVAQDETCKNVTRVEVPYVGKYKKDGTESKTYNFLMNVIENKLTVESSGVDNAAKIKFVQSRLVGEEYFSDKNRDEEGNLVLSSTPKTEAGFSIFEQKQLNENMIQRNLFSCDIIIKDVQMKQGNDDVPDKLILHSFIGGKNKNEDGSYGVLLMPFDFTVENPNGINYFLELGVTPQNPIFTKIMGTIRTTVTEEKTDIVQEEVAFGESIELPVAPKENREREFIVLNAKAHPYPLSDPKFMTLEELKQLLDYREKVNVEKKDSTEKRIAERANQMASDMGAFVNIPDGLNVEGDGLIIEGEIPSFDLSDLN